MNLTALANDFGSDKGTTAGHPPHKYTYLYDLLFYPYRSKDINFLELGLAVGGPEVGGPVDRNVGSPSVSMWSRFFTRAKIYGFDISDFSHIKHDRFQFIRGDSGCLVDLQKLVRVAANFDVIVDDASHASYHQQLAFKTLFPRVSPGGLYIIEDLHWQSPYFEQRLPNVPKTAVFFEEYFENNVYIVNSLISRTEMDDIRGIVQSYSAFPSFVGDNHGTKMIVLRKSE